MYFFCNFANSFYVRFYIPHGLLFTTYLCANALPIVKKIISVIDIIPIKGSVQTSLYHVICNIFIMYYNVLISTNQLVSIELFQNVQIGAVVNISAM